MRITFLAAILLLAPSTCSWTQQQNSTPNQNPQQPTVIVRSPDSTAEDQAVPLCTAMSAGGSGMNPAEIDNHIKPPVIIHSVEGSFSDQARRTIRKRHIRNFNDIVLIRLIVDETGRPESLCLQRSLGLGLDANAAAAIQQYRFIPATKDGNFISDIIYIEVDYKLW